MIDTKKVTDPNPAQGYCPAPGVGKDEISLLDIWQALKHEWKLIVGILIAVTLAALIIALMMPKVYRAEVVLLPPLESNVEMLNIPDLNEITVDELYRKMIRNLQSNALRYRFFKEHKLFAVLGGGEESNQYKVFQKRFNDLFFVKDSVTVTGNNLPESEVVTISLDGANPEQVSSWLNKYVALADAVTIQSVISVIDARVNVRKTDVREKINSLRVIAEKQRFDYIAHLNEAIFVADKLGLKEQDSSLYGNNFSQKEHLGIVLNVTGKPLYTRGSNALRAKVEAMKNRKNDDPFIDGLRELEGEFSYLEKINVKDKRLHPARIDQRAVPDDVPFKPKRKLIVVLGFMIGAMLAVVVVMIRVFFLQKMEE